MGAFIASDDFAAVKRKQAWLTLPEGVPTWPESAPATELLQALAQR